jgi:phosphatidylserine decarboxylase
VSAVVNAITDFRLRPEGRIFVAAFAAAALLLFLLADFLGWIGVILTVWCVFFFRDPDRVTPVEAGLVISPADGVVQETVLAIPPPELHMGETPMKRVGIFMNVFDCHVNRSPVDGTIVASAYRPGAFLNAELDKASEDNERRAIHIRTDGGTDIAVVQIAGLVARRIICWTPDGHELKAGERYGMIRFGSRVDVYLPQSARVLAVAGQRAVSGETVLATLEGDSETDRAGEIR